MSILRYMARQIIGGERGRDCDCAVRMLDNGRMMQEQSDPGRIWADYYFIAACYSSAWDNEQTVKYAVGKIWQGWSNYDPVSRFTAGVDDTLRYRVPVMARLDEFCRTHPDFSFSDALGDYFPSLRVWSLRKSMLETLCDPKLAEEIAKTKAKE